jgi:hypothetical protein
VQQSSTPALFTPQGYKTAPGLNPAAKTPFGFLNHVKILIRKTSDRNHQAARIGKLLKERLRLICVGMS